MRRAAVLIITFGIILLMTGLLLGQSMIILQRVAGVSAVKGDVWVVSKDGTKERRLENDQRIQAGDTIKTGDEAAVTLNWVDGTRMRIGANTVITVLKCHFNTLSRTESSLFQLDIGRVWIRVLKSLSPKSKFEVHTPTATAGVRGTVFSVAVDADGSTHISVVDGQVDVRGAGERLSVRDEQMASVAGTRAHVGALAAGERSLWEKHMDVASPRLVINSPDEDQVVRPGDILEISGSTEMGAHVTINGEEVTTGLKGSFRTTVPVPGEGDEFEVLIIVTDRHGYENTAQMMLKVESATD